MDIKKQRKRILQAAENSVEELIKVMNRKIDFDEVDPEKLKVSASAYRQAMEDAITMLDKVEDIKLLLESPVDGKKEAKSFFGVETRVK